MKIFFEPLNSEWARNWGVAKKWEKVLSEWSLNDDGHSVTDNRNIADVVIYTQTEAIGLSSVREVFRPLSNADVQSFALDWGDHPTGRLSGFYSALDVRMFDPNRHRTIHYPIELNDLVEEFPRDNARYNFGFLGGENASVRRRMYEQFKPRERKDNSFIKAQAAHWPHILTGSDMTPMKTEYLEFLSATKFILCPRGFGFGSARMFEAMKAGRVPVIISDGYVLPADIDWSCCSIRIGEREIDKIPEIIERHMEDWPKMAANARLTWEENFSNRKFLRYLVKNIEAMRETIPNINYGKQIAHFFRIGTERAKLSCRAKLGQMKQGLKEFLRVIPA